MHPHQILLGLHGELLRHDHKKLPLGLLHGLGNDFFKHVMGFSCAGISQNQL